MKVVCHGHLCWRKIGLGLGLPENSGKSPVFVLTVQIKTKQLNDSDLVDSKIYNERIEVIL